MTENGTPETPPQMTAEMWRVMQDAARAAGLEVAPPEGEKPSAPTLDLQMPWRRLGLELGGILKSRNIFLRAGELGRVNETTAEWETFEPKNFAGWVEEFVAWRWKGERAKLSGEQAAMLMAQFSFREQIRAIEGIHKVRVPVIRASGRAEWLAKGYDAETRIFTVPLLAYPLDWTIEKATEYLDGVFCDFPWMRGEDEDASTLKGNRAYAVHLAAMVGVYCRACFPAGTLKPLMAYIANQQGSGKTVLALAAIAPVFGLAASNPLPKNDDDLRKELDAAVQAFAPFLFFDDIPYLNSQHLNRFITSPRFAGRVLGSKDQFDVPAVTQIFATGNDVKGSKDIALRSMCVELFYAGDLKGRKFDKTIDEDWLSRHETRCDMLAALAALVRHWDAREGGVKAHLDGMAGMPRFARFSKLTAGVVRAACYADPLSPPLLPMDEEVDQIQDLLIAAASKSEKDESWTREQLVNLARELELCEDLVGTAGDKDLDSASSKRFGYRMRPFRGRELMDKQGRKFRFGHMRKRTGATYPLAFLK